MNLAYYVKNPSKAILKLNLIIFNRSRGLFYSFVFRSGKHLNVGKNSSFEIQKIKFNNRIIIGNNVRIFGSGKLFLGNNVFIGDNTTICVESEILIDSDSMIAANCYLTDTNHSTRGTQIFRLQKNRFKKTSIGKNVWIGANSNILSGAVIGNNSVIGAGSTINTFIESDSFVIPKRELIVTRRE